MRKLFAHLNRVIAGGMEFFKGLFKPKVEEDDSNTTSFVCMSDTHSKHAMVKLPEADVMLHAGDWSMMGTVDEVREFNRWLGTLPYKHKCVVAGNHEVTFEHVKEAEIRARFQIV